MIEGFVIDEGRRNSLAQWVLMKHLYRKRGVTKC